MTLSAAFNTVQSMFRNNGTAANVLTVNTANETNEAYARRTANTLTNIYGGAEVVVRQAQDFGLLKQALNATSEDSAQQQLYNGLLGISNIYGGNEQSFSPGTYLNNLVKSLSDYAAKPSDNALGDGVVARARDMVNSLRDTSAALQAARAQADADIANAVNKLNDLLGQFKVANDLAVSQTAAGQEPFDAIDARQKALNGISEIVGVTVMRRPNNDLVLYTSDGTTLFESSARTVSFTQTFTYDATINGNGIKIDGVPVKPGAGGDTTAKGTLGALLQLRDQVVPVMQKQIDEVARGLITTFAETDGTNTAPGLFTWATGTIPTAGTVVPNLAALISVNAAVDPAQGGVSSRLRDGSINGATYNRNTGNNASFSTVLNKYVTGLNTAMTFDATTQLHPSASLVAFTNGSIGWLEEIRSSALSGKENKAAAKTQSVNAYSNSTGVNLDQQTALMMDLDNAQRTTAKIFSAIDDMLKSLLNAVG